MSPTQHMNTELPSLAVLGEDLTHISPRSRVITLAMPFFCVAVYALCAMFHLWPFAVISLMYLSFITYGSVSHDLVHRNLGLSRRANNLLLCAVELLTLRSGHAYRLGHLHHHASYPHDDDIEAHRWYRNFMFGPQAGSLVQAIPETISTSKHTFKVLHTPGHSPDHICLYEAAEGWLFSGDLYTWCDHS